MTISRGMHDDSECMPRHGLLTCRLSLPPPRPPSPSRLHSFPSLPPPFRPLLLPPLLLPILSMRAVLPARLCPAATPRDLLSSSLPYLVKVEDEVYLADVSKVSIQHFHKAMDGLQIGELIVGDVNTEGEEEARVSSINNLIRSKLPKRERKRKRG